MLSGLGSQKTGTEILLITCTMTRRLQCLPTRTAPNTPHPEATPDCPHYDLYDLHHEDVSGEEDYVRWQMLAHI